MLPALALAQSNQTVTRAQVRTELMQLEQAGYNPYARDWLYPDGLKSAEAKVAEQQRAATTGYGSDSAGTVESGR